MIGYSGKSCAAEEISGDVAQKLIRLRGFSESGGKRLTPSITEEFPKEGYVLDADVVAVTLCDAVMSGSRIGIYTDYDADGATSAGVLGRFIRIAGGVVSSVRAPDRMLHGYGPNAEILREMLDASDEVVVLDSGTAAAGVFSELTQQQRGRICVIDHHMPSGPIPDVKAVVNANRPDQASGFGHLAAVGMTFCVCVFASRELIRRGHMRRESLMDVMGLLDYVAVGTVCDVVPLTGLNRAFVQRGLPLIRRSPALSALMRVAGKDPDVVTSRDCGFVIGPRLNAEGRIGESDYAARFLLETSSEKIRDMAARMNETNARRKAEEKRSTDQALAQASEVRKSAHDPVIAVVEAHEGVVGISASRVKDAINAPAFVLTEDRSGNLKGSGRSVPGFNLGDAIHELVEDGVLMRGGGHAAAGGVTLARADLDGFRAGLARLVMSSDFGKEGPSKSYDGVLSAKDVSVDLIRGMSVMEPFGQGNPEPEFIVSGRVVSVKVISGKHIKVTLEGRTGKENLDAVMWSAIGTEAGGALLGADGKFLSVAGKLTINDYDGKPQIIMDDVMRDDSPRHSPERWGPI